MLHCKSHVDRRCHSSAYSVFVLHTEESATYLLRQADPELRKPGCETSNVLQSDLQEHCVLGEGAYGKVTLVSTPMQPNVAAKLAKARAQIPADVFNAYSVSSCKNLPKNIWCRSLMSAAQVLCLLPL